MIVENMRSLGAGELVRVTLREAPENLQWQQTCLLCGNTFDRESIIAIAQVEEHAPGVLCHRCLRGGPVAAVAHVRAHAAAVRRWAEQLEQIAAGLPSQTWPSIEELKARAILCEKAKGYKSNVSEAAH